VIRAYSTTWYDPVVAMPPRLNEALSAAYLCMRAIDEIEDHPHLDGETKGAVLNGVSRILQTRFAQGDFDTAFADHREALPEVTQRLGEWAALAPPEIAPRVLETFSTMAERMATWAKCGWRIREKRDLDRYTYAVAGTLVLMLSDLWAWYDGTSTNRTDGVGYGRALQAVNIIIDRVEDTKRCVDFWPNGWGLADMVRYARQELARADAYVAELPTGPARTFCDVPLRNAHRAIDRACAAANESVNVKESAS
jgi:farnesyl-diphosphate farnesyltransferase